MGFSPNILVDIQQILSFQFMQHAYEAGTMVAIIAGFTGYFVVIRRSTFVAHAFSEIGFSGAAGAVLVSSVTSIAVPPIAGLLLGSMLGGLAIGLLGRRATYRDVHIGIVLAFTLGLGLLFISLYPGYATETYSILFGEILGINSNDVYLTLISGLIILAAISLVYRPLLFSSLDEELAEAKGVPMLPLGIVFMMIVAVAVSISIQFTGVLLIFSLMVTPAATAQYLASTPRQVIAFSVLISLAATWLGLFVAFYEAPPVSFFITTFAFAFYLFVRFVFRRVRPMHPRTIPLQVPS